MILGCLGNMERASNDRFGSRFLNAGWRRIAHQWHSVAVAVAFVLSRDARAQEVAQDFATSFAPPSWSDAAPRAVSPSRRIIVSGGTAGENAELAMAAEEALQRVETLLGFEVPFTRMDPIRIVLERVDGVESGQVVKAQGWADLQLIQRIYVVNADRVDQEDLLEALCGMVLDRCVTFRRRSEENPDSLSRAPNWISVGIAQNLYPALRARNAAIMADQWRSGCNPSLAEVFTWRQLPAGRWGEKAAAGLAVGLLLAQADKNALLACLLDRVAEDPVLHLNALQDCDSIHRSPTAWEKEWDVWIAAQGELLRVTDEEPDELLRKLRATLEIAPMDLGLPQESSIPSQLTLDELIARRYEPWMGPLASLVGFQIRALAIGRWPAFGEVAEAYGRYFDALASCSREGWFRRKLFARHRGRALRRLLDHARRKHEQLEADLPTQSANTVDVSRVGQASEGMRRFFTRAERPILPDTRGTGMNAAGP